MVTHSNIDASYAERVIFIKDGKLYHEIYRGEESRDEYQKRIADSLAILNGRVISVPFKMIWTMVKRGFVTQRHIIIFYYRCEYYVWNRVYTFVNYV